MFGSLGRNAAYGAVRVLRTRGVPSNLGVSLLRAWRVPSMVVSTHRVLLSSTAFRLNETSPSETDSPTEQYAGSSPSEPSKTLFVAGLPFHFGDREVVAFFEDMPGFLEIKIPGSRRSKGYAFVTFSSIDDAKAAYENITNETPTLGGRQLRVDYSRQHQSVISQPVSDTVFVANLTSQITSDTLRDSFSKYGDVLNVRLVPVEGNRAIAWLKFGDESQAQAAVTAMQRKPIEPEGYPIRLDFAINKDRDRTTADRKPNERLFIAGFGSHPPEEVAEAFNRFQVKSFKVATDPVSNEPRGYGWVEFETTADAMTAMDTILSEKVAFKGAPLRIEFAASRTSSKTRRNREQGLGRA